MKGRIGTLFAYGCLLFIALTWASPVRAETPAGSKTLQGRYLQAIDREIQRTGRLLRRELETRKADDTQRLAQLTAINKELRRHEARLESWLSRSEIEPYGRNFPRFLRTLYSQLRRLREDLESLAHGEEAAPAEPDRSRGVFPARGHSAGKPMKPEPHPWATASRAERGMEQPAVPANDDCWAATPIGDGIFGGNTESATNDGEATCGSSETSPDVWFRYTAGNSGTVDFNTFRSSFDTVLSLHSTCPGTTFNQLECNDDWSSLQSRLTHEMAVGQEVVVRVSGYYGDTGDFQLNIGRTGQIAGRVVDDATGLGLVGTYIDIYDVGGNWFDEVTAGALGAYAFEDFSPGTYFVKATNFPYITELYDDIECLDWCEPESGTPVLVASGETVVVDFALTLGGMITGTVTDTQTGQTIANVRVEIYDEAGHWIDSERTNDQGVYSVEGLGAGIYFANTDSDSGYIDELYDDIPCPDSCDPTEGSPISVETTEIVQVDFDLQLGGSVAGTITDAQTGHFVPYVDVEIYDESGSRVGDGWTGDVGEYSVIGLPSGTYYAVAERWNYVAELYDDIPCPGGCDPTFGTPIAVTIGEVTDGIDFALDREGAISGIVLDEAVGAPVSYCDVDVWSQEGDWVGDGWGNFWGNYTAGGLPAGTYHVTTDNDTGYLDELYDDLPCVWGGCDPRSGTAIEVETGMNTTGVDFHLMLGGSITGSVTDVATGSPVEGRVEVISANGEKVGERWIDNGRYLLSGLPTADYFVRTYNLDGYTDGVYDGIFCPSGCDPTTGTPVRVVAGFTTTGIDFELCGPPVLEPHFPPSADPQSFIVGCLVQIGGTAASYHPGCPAIERIFWDWGDGGSGYRPMPARHLYKTLNGRLVTVSVTAYDVLGGESETVQGEIELRRCRPRGFR